MPNGEETWELAWELARELLACNRFVTIGTNQKTIYRYAQVEGIYKPDGQTYVERKIEENFERKQDVSNHLVKEVLGHIERSTARDISIIEEKNPHLVLENCLFNLNTFIAEPFTPDYYSTAKMPVSFDPTNDYQKSRFYTTLNEILDPADVEGRAGGIRANTCKGVFDEEAFDLRGETRIRGRLLS